MHTYFTSLIRGNSHPLHLRDFNLQVLTFAVLSMSVSWLRAQEEIPFLEWSHPRGEQEMFTTAKATTDHAGNSVLIGQTIGANGDYDILLVKQDRDGQEIWNLQVSGTGNGDDFGAAVCVDANNVVYATGTVDNGSLNELDTWVCAISPDGTILWETEYDTGSNLSEVGTSIDIDSQGGVYVGGSTSTANGSFDLMGLKLNQLEGSVTWASSWDFVGLIDGATATRCTGSKVIFTGGAQASATSWRGVSVAYAVNDGQLLGEYVTNGGDVSVDVINDVQISPSGDILVAGSVQEIGGQMQQVIIKLSPYMEELWSIQSGPEIGIGDFEANGIEVTELGEVVVCGTHTTSDSSNVVISKYTSVGSLIWQENIPLEGWTTQEAVDIAVDPQDNSIVILTNKTTYENKDIVLLKRSSNGELVWSKAFNGVMNGNDVGLDLCFDTDGSIIVAAQSNGIDGIEYLIQRYTSHNLIVPEFNEISQDLCFFEENVGQILASTDSISSIDTRTVNSAYGLHTNDGSVILTYSVGDSSAAYIQNVRLFFGKEGDESHFRGTFPFEYYSNYYHTAIDGIKREHVPSFPLLSLPQFADGMDVTLRQNGPKSSSIFITIAPGIDPSSFSFSISSPLDILQTGESITWQTLTGAQSMLVAGHDLISSTGNLVGTNTSSFCQIDNLGTVTLIGCEQDSLNYQFIELKIGENTTLPNSVQQIACGLWWSTYLHHTTAGGVSAQNTNGLDVAFNHSGFIHNVGQTQDILDLDTEFGTSDIIPIILPNPPGQWGYVLTLKNEAQPLWCTYFGASSSGISCNYIETSSVPNEEDIIVSGNISSQNLPPEFPLVQDCFQCTPGGGETEGFICKIKISGELEWSNYFGGNGDDIIHSSCERTSESSVYIVGKTTSSSDFPLLEAQGGSYYQDEISSPSSEDGFIAEVSWNGELLWSTYYGTNTASGKTNICDCASPHTSPQKLVLTGIVEGDIAPTVNGTITSPPTGFPICRQSPNDANFTNTFNAPSRFISEFNADDRNLKWSTLLPSNGDAASFAPNVISITSHENRDVIYGTTTNPLLYSGLNYTVDSYQKPPLNGDISDAFIMDFVNRKLTWSTLLGGGSHEAASQAQIAWDGSLFLLGSTGSPPPPTEQECSNQPNPYYFPICSNTGATTIDNTIDGLIDGFIAKINPERQLEWSTFHGGNDVDQMFALDINNEGTGPGTGSFVAVTGTTFSTDESFYTPNDVWDGELLVSSSNAGANQGILSIFKMHPSCFQESPPPLLVENEIVEPVQFDCFPNPTNGTLTIIYPYSEQTLYISIFDMLGREALQIEVNQNTSSTTINLNELSSGLYVVSLSGNRQNSKLILKQ